MPTRKAERLLALTRPGNLTRADLESYTEQEATRAVSQLDSLSASIAAANEARPRFIHSRGRQLIGLDGRPIALRGYRINNRHLIKWGPLPLADLERWRDAGLLGNAQGCEIWWSRGGGDSPSESRSDRPGEYNEAALETLLESLRNIARAGSWIIPSFRVSYDGKLSPAAAANGTQIWQGWADHASVIRDRPVICKGKQYGTHRARFFAWLDWIVPKLLGDPIIAPAIASWEMWHYPGHKHNIGGETLEIFLDDFIPALIAQFRKHDPNRMLAVPFVPNIAVNRAIQRFEAGTWKPYSDPNLCYMVGGYCLHGHSVVDSPNAPRNRSFPAGCVNPEYIASRGEFNIETFGRLTGVAMHEQEGPGLNQNFRTTPLPALQHGIVSGLLDLYNRETNGFGWHDYPPSWADRAAKVKGFDETALFDLLRTALKG
jgi:hypothetical protein